MAKFFAALAIVIAVFTATHTTTAFAATHHHRAYCVPAHTVRGHWVHTKRGRTYYVRAHTVHGYCVAAR